jgi:hypothetical protein
MLDLQKAREMLSESIFDDEHPPNLIVIAPSVAILMQLDIKQYRFPRSKKNRIRRKWAQNMNNYKKRD